MGKKIIKWGIFLLIIISLIWRYFYYIDIKNGCFIRINPSFMEFSNLNIKEGLRALKYASPKDYKAVCDNIKVIHPNVSCGGFGGGCFYPDDQKSISVTTSQKSILNWTAAVIYHEVCHALQHKEKRLMSEDECYKESSRILKTMIVY